LACILKVSDSSLRLAISCTDGSFVVSLLAANKIRRQFHERCQDRLFRYPFPFSVAFLIILIIAFGAEHRIGLTNRQLAHLKDGVCCLTKRYTDYKCYIVKCPIIVHFPNVANRYFLAKRCCLRTAI
jgi:hypothetical protein